MKPGGYCWGGGDSWSSVNTLGGASGNVISNGVMGGTIAGGGGITNHLFSAEASPNTVLANFATVGGGLKNTAGLASTNFDLARAATVAGGENNTASNEWATVGGGFGNISSGIFATVPGGADNFAGGFCSFAAGFLATATHSGSFVWADSQLASFSTTADDQFLIRAYGGVGIGVNSPQQQLSVAAGVNIDQADANNGAQGPGLAFGSNSGEGIASKRNSGGNQYGLDFFTASLSRLSIANGGNVGIGTATPRALLNVNGATRIDATPASYNEGLSLNLPTDMAGGGYGGIHFHSATRGAAYNNSTIKWGLFYNYRAEGVGGNGLAFVQNNTATRLYLATNGFVGIGTITPTNTLHVAGGVSATIFVTTSDRNAKENFAAISPKEVLARVAALPITTWNFKEMPGLRHMGPMAQDFYAAFGLGGSDTTITTVDPDGVALAAIQGLNEKLEQKETEITELKQRLEKLERLVAAQK